MKIDKNFTSLFFIIFFLISSCTTVPVTGRKQFNVIPSYALLSTSTQQYHDFLKSKKVNRNWQQTQMVRRVGARIQRAVEQYLIANNMADELKNYDWEFNLIESQEANAWAMPGGKVAVYTGILPITRDDTGLAVVMGHEIAHVVAAHGNERMSQALAFQMGGTALSTLLTQKPAETQKLWKTAYGLGAQYGVLLPYNRLQEAEADHLGLIFMAMAGYDPNKAIGFWQRMAQKKKGREPPEFLSTHPSDERRIREIRALLPKVMPYYKKSR